MVKLVICIAEDRASMEPALRVLIASLHRHAPKVDAHVFAPNATPAFQAWAQRFPNCRLRVERLPGEYRSYDVKPHALLTMFGEGHEDVMWIDSDILVLGDPSRLTDGLSPETLLVTEEALNGGHDDPDAFRTRKWGWEVGRTLPFALNTGVIRVTPHHTQLLKDWLVHLQNPDYLAAQNKPWFERGIHLLTDQEVLTAMMASKAHAHVPLKLLTRGREIIQFFGMNGYTVRERLRNIVSPKPTFVHSMGYRPFWPRQPERGVGGWMKQLYRDLSPYTLIARDYQSELEDTAWLKAPTATSGTLRFLGFSTPWLHGIPIAVLGDLNRTAKRVRASLGGKPRGGFFD